MKPDRDPTAGMLADQGADAVLVADLAPDDPRRVYVDSEAAAQRQRMGMPPLVAVRLPVPCARCKGSGREPEGGGRG